MEISRKSGAAAGSPNVLRMIEIPTSTVLLKLAAHSALKGIQALSTEAMVRN